MCLEKNRTPREIAKTQALITELQQRLLRDDQTMRSRVNQDPKDLARIAKISASGERDDTPPANVIDGHLRDIPKGAKHQWSAKMTPEGAWLELRWNKPQKVSQVQLTFDSGFQRELTLTSSDSINNGILRQPQPETVKDYKLYYEPANGGEHVMLTGEKGNYCHFQNYLAEFRQHYSAYVPGSVRLNWFGGGPSTSLLCTVRLPASFSLDRFERIGITSYNPVKCELMQVTLSSVFEDDSLSAGESKL